jgi:lysozyme
MPIHQSYLSAIKTFEGFTSQAKWDYAQHSNGFGTKALYPGEKIDTAEAERRFAAEITIARDIVEKHAPGWDEGTKAALTSLTFNAGTKWISSGLGDAVRSGDIEGVRERFVQYSKAQGEVLPGLLKRRLAEVDWIGSGAAGATATATPVSAGATVTGSLPSPEPSPPQSLQPLPPTTSSGPIAPMASASAAPTAVARGEVAATLRDQLSGFASADITDAKNAQSLSTLMTLLFDLQMRTGVTGPRDAQDGTTAPSAGRPQQAL